MPNLEWEVPHTLTSPLGSLNLNAVDAMTGFWYIIQPENYKIVPAMRVTADHVSQQSGSVVHRRFTSGLVATMTIHYAVAPTHAGPDFEPACGANLRLMHEGLMKHIEALLSISADPNTNQRLTWTPTGLGGTRLISQIQTLGWAEPSWLNIGSAVTFSVECPLPYAVDGTQVNTTVTNGGGPVLIPNAGTTPFFPVWQVHGTTSAFTIVNEDTGETIVYNGDTISGGGNYVEIVTFLGTAYKNGSSTDLIASIDAVNTDFFTIAPGGTNVSISGANAHVFTNNAYC